MEGDRKKGREVKSSGRRRDEGRGNGGGGGGKSAREQHVHKSKAVRWSTSTVMLAFVP